MANIHDKLFQLLYKVAYRLSLCVWYIFRPSSYGVYISVWHDGKILVIRNSYKTEYTFPSGGIKRGESEEDAAARELLEEVNIQTWPDLLLFVGRFRGSHEFKKDTGTFFEMVCSAPPKIKVDDREVVTAEFLTPTEALGLDLSPFVRAYLREREGPNPSSHFDFLL